MWSLQAQILTATCTPCLNRILPLSSCPTRPKLAGYDLEPLKTDVILTFSQTVEQEVQGGCDMSRYPAVNELYDKANDLRLKLAMSLDATDRKEHVPVHLGISNSTDACAQNCYRRWTKWIFFNITTCSSNYHGLLGRPPAQSYVSS